VKGCQKWQPFVSETHFPKAEGALENVG